MSTTLVVIYNHSHPANIEKIERYYSSNFSRIIHVIPFHLAEKENVVSVFEISYMFAGHIASSWSRLVKCDTDFYTFIGDDLILNPTIDEHNLPFQFNVNPMRAYIDCYFSLGEVNHFWRRAVEAIRWTPNKKGVELPDYFPTAELMFERLASTDSFSMIVPREAVIRSYSRFSGKNPLKTLRTNIWTAQSNIKFFSRQSRNLKYPVIGGYSDIVVIPRNFISDFCRLCGIFNTLGLHTELTIPTVLRYLFGESISTAQNSNVSRAIAWEGNIALDLKNVENSIESLRDNFPIGLAYAHPVKLSKFQ